VVDNDAAEIAREYVCDEQLLAPAFNSVQVSIKISKTRRRRAGLQVCPFCLYDHNIIKWLYFSFLTRLHHGQVSIIPWPVIESKKFYSSFSLLQKMLRNQKITHSSAGMFLHTLKTLMAKLKVGKIHSTTFSNLTRFGQTNDWGALNRE